MLVLADVGRDPVGDVLLLAVYGPEAAASIFAWAARKIDANNLVEHYRLDGFYPFELKRVVDNLVARFESKAALQLPELFLIVDYEGYTIDMDWDSLAKVGKYECHFCPDVLAIARSRARDFSECLERNVVTSIGEYLVATKVK